MTLVAHHQVLNQDVDKFPRYLAVSSGYFPEDFYAVLTPKAMQWTDTIWLLDLHLSKTYWLNQALSRGLDWQTLLNEFVSLTLRSDSYSLVYSPDPWKAVVFANYMIEKSLTGSINLLDQFGARVFQQISWSCWFCAAHQYAAACMALKIGKFNDRIFKKGILQLKIAMAKLSEPRPLAIKNLEAQHLRRRYGTHVAKLWEWTTSRLLPDRSVQKSLFDDDEDDVFSQDFPWKDWLPSKRPFVRRDLDFSLFQWADMEPCLVEDFDRLCSSEDWKSGDLTTHISFEILLSDASTIKASIRFRSPHSLHLERKSHKTAIIQAYYAFFDAFGSKASVDEDGLIQPVVGWTLQVEELLKASPIMASLFGDLESFDAGSSLTRIENQFRVAVQRYSLSLDWLPEDSFSGVASEILDSSQVLPWVFMAKRRPLYIFKEPILLDSSEAQLKNMIFTERITEKWWISDDSRLRERDYYAIEDFQDRWRWAFKDERGRWLIHGVFG
jgi:hypothetical protein